MSAFIKERFASRLTTIALCVSLLLASGCSLQPETMPLLPSDAGETATASMATDEETAAAPDTASAEGQASATAQTEASAAAETPSGTGTAGETATGELQGGEAVDIPTPYQFFAMMAANADALSFPYTVTPVEGEAWTATYARQGERARAAYTATDMNGNPVAVEEFAVDGATWFALPERKILYRYEGTGTHLIEAELLAAVQGEASETIVDGARAVTTHVVPLPQDPDTPVAYRFTMQADGPVQVEVSIGGEPHHTIVFGALSSDPVPDSTLQLPEGYRTESFDYPYDDAHMPPWWDGGDDM